MAGSTDDAGFTACRHPEGLRICGTATPARRSADRLHRVHIPDAERERLRRTDRSAFMVSAPNCADGFVCAQEDPDPSPRSYGCADFNLGVLLAKYDPSMVRYADLGDWTGDPLPEPTTCPTVSGFTLCGGNCGGCPAGQVCTGRSPLHPYGFCFPQYADFCSVDGFETCDADAGPQSCFVFNVQPDAQAVANDYGKCMTPATCQAIATGLPGGGTCYAQ